MITSLHDVCDVQVLGHFRLRLTFSDGLIGDVDLSYLSGQEGVFTALHDPAYLAQVRVDAEIGTVEDAGQRWGARGSNPEPTD